MNENKKAVEYCPKCGQKLDWEEEQMEIREMTDKEIIETLNKLKSYFDSPLFENNRSVINALQVAVEAIENKEDSKKLNKTPFDRVNKEEQYCLIGTDNGISVVREYNEPFDDIQYECSNYFNDKYFANQIALHQLLYRKLLKFKLEREQETKISSMSSFISLDKMNVPYVDETCRVNRNSNGVYFNERSTAKLALKEVVEPFLEEHSEFIWNL